MQKFFRIDIILIVVLTAALTLFILSQTTEFGPLAGAPPVIEVDATEAPDDAATPEAEMTTEAEATDEADDTEATEEAEATEESS